MNASRPFYRQLIAGDWVDAAHGATRPLTNPGTGVDELSVPFGNGEDARAAIEAASQAAAAWRAQTVQQRADLLWAGARLVRERVEAIADAMVLESGKPRAQAVGETVVAAQLFEWYAEEAKRAFGRTVPTTQPGRRSTVVHEAVGVVGVITAWNFPAYNPARSWAPALAAGCTVVARPSELTPLSAMHVANALVDAGLPAGVLNLINGDPPAMAQVLLDDPRCRKIAFTGSVRVGRLLMEGASRTLTRLSLELGGNAPVIVCDDVDLERVALGSVTAKFRNAGQVCVAPQRFIVHEAIYSEFLERVAARTRSLRVGLGNDPSTDVGPLITSVQRDRVLACVRKTCDAGAALRCGGQVPRELEGGFFLEPAVLADVRPGMPAFDDEIFGPVMAVTPFSSIDEALELANHSELGLAAYVWTSSLERATRISEALDVGMVAVNSWRPHGVEIPFPPRKYSGFGHTCGSEGLAEFLDTKVISVES